MRKSKRTILFSVAVLLVSAVALLVTANSSTAQPEQHVATPAGPVELPDVLQTRPDLPVASIPVVSPTPGHPLQGLPGPGSGCDKDIDLTSTIEGVTNVAALDTGICTNSDVDSYVRGGRTYVVIAGGDDAAWTHIDVTDPANPVIAGQFKLKGSGKNTYTPDVKIFQQGSDDYMVLALERRTPLAPAGAVIYQVNNPANPVKRSQITGSDWIDVHNVFVEDDGSGNGRYLYITADNTADLRVFDIADPANPIELGTYRRTDSSFGVSGFYDDIYVHDVTVKDGTVYASYWEAGLDIFPASLVKTAGTVINESNPDVVNIDPSNFVSGNPFLTHHAFPSNDGNLVFLQDEIEIDPSEEPSAEVVQMWALNAAACNPAPCYVDGLAQGSDIPVIPAHNLEIRHDLVTDRLHVGWYKAGLQAWDFSGAGFSRPNPEDRTAVQYHQVQTEANDNLYSGTWGLRMETIGTNLYIFQSDRNFGLIVDCAGCAVSPSPPPPPPPPPSSDTGSIKGKVTNAITNKNLNDVMVEIVETAQSDITNKGGRYTIGDVAENTVTVKASKPGFIDGEETGVVVTADQTTTVNFALVPQ